MSTDSTAKVTDLRAPQPHDAQTSANLWNTAYTSTGIDAPPIGTHPQTRVADASGSAGIPGNIYDALARTRSPGGVPKSGSEGDVLYSTKELYPKAPGVRTAQQEPGRPGQGEDQTTRPEDRTANGADTPSKPKIEINWSAVRPEQVQRLQREIDKIPPEEQKRLAEQGYSFVIDHPPNNVPGTPDYPPSDKRIYVYEGNDPKAGNVAVFRQQESADRYTENSYQEGRGERKWVSSKTHEPDGDGGFKDTTVKPDGTTVRVQKANGDFTETVTNTNGELVSTRTRAYDNSGEFTETLVDGAGKPLLPKIEAKGVSKEFADDMIRTVESLPPAELQALIAKNVTIQLLPKGALDNLTGCGAEKCEPAVGVYEPEIPDIKVTDLPNAAFHLRHEAGHAVDDYNELLKSPEIAKAFHEDVSHVDQWPDKQREILDYLLPGGSRNRSEEDARREAIADMISALQDKGPSAHARDVLDRFPALAEAMRRRLESLNMLH